MHPILFGLKRAFRTSTQFCHRHLLARYCLTPSRFDILYLLRNGPLTQREIRRRLGISSTTVSRMIRALVEWNYLRRERIPEDRRGYLVHLTDVGIIRAKAAITQMLRFRTAIRMLRVIFDWRGAREEASRRMAYVEQGLFTMERWFGTRVADLDYPSWPPRADEDRDPTPTAALTPPAAPPRASAAASP